MSGGLSQLESWDPKPKTTTGGPFRAIPTAVPGVHISELLPLTAMQMDKLALVRSINTKNGDHGKGSYQMLHGRNQRPGVQLPNLGAVCAKALESPTNPCRDTFVSAAADVETTPPIWGRGMPALASTASRRPIPHGLDR